MMAVGKVQQANPICAENLTHSSRRLVAQNSLNLLKDLWRQLGKDLQCLQVIEHLLRFRRAENDRARVGVLNHPCQC